jgi:hypothetical protein
MRYSGVTLMIEVNLKLQILDITGECEALDLERQAAWEFTAS